MQIKHGRRMQMQSDVSKCLHVDVRMAPQCWSSLTA